MKNLIAVLALVLLVPSFAYAAPLGQAKASVTGPIVGVDLVRIQGVSCVVFIAVGKDRIPVVVPTGVPLLCNIPFVGSVKVEAEVFSNPGTYTTTLVATSVKTTPRLVP